ncbi:MAG: PadR family transcriptional regulator [Acidobacteria bacterium]|nr:PadR family transcriptional regulator [Acidobacteriota bacterium]
MGDQTRFLGEFELMVLLAVAQLGDTARAVDVRGNIQDRAGRNVSRGSLYITLERLEAKGYLTWRTEDPVDGRRGVPRRVFEVTTSGLEALRVSHSAIANLSKGLEKLLSP